MRRRGRTRHRRHRPARTAPRSNPSRRPGTRSGRCRGAAPARAACGATSPPGCDLTTALAGAEVVVHAASDPRGRPVAGRRRGHPAAGRGGRPRPAAAPGLRLDRRRRPHPLRLLPRQVRRRAGAAGLRPAGDPAAGHPVPRLRRRPARHRPARPGPPGADGLAGAAGRRRARSPAHVTEVCAAPPTGGRRRVRRPGGAVGGRPGPRLGRGPRAGRARGGHPGAGQAEHGLPGRRRAALRAPAGTRTYAAAPGRLTRPAASRRSTCGASCRSCTRAAAAPAFVDVPPLPYLMIDGHRDPDTAPAYADAVQALYSLAYTIRFALKRAPRPRGRPRHAPGGPLVDAGHVDLLHRAQVARGTGR